MSNKVDVVGAILAMVTQEGNVIAQWNYPRGTGHVANKLQFRPRDGDGRIVRHKSPTTASVLRALERAERDGLVKFVGTGEHHNRAWNKNAADCKERYWMLTDAALPIDKERT